MSKGVVRMLYISFLFTKHNYFQGFQMFVEITAEQFYSSAKAVPSTNDGIRVKYRQVNLALYMHNSIRNVA